MKNLKVSSLFHWLYGAVMFLPILLLPVFMIYSHRHTIDSGILEVPQTEVVSFNQQIKNGNFTNFDYWNTQYSVSSYQIINNECIVISTSGSTDNTYIYQNDFNLFNNHIYMLKGEYQLLNLVSNSWLYSYFPGVSGTYIQSYVTDTNLHLLNRQFTCVGNRNVVFEIGFRNDAGNSMEYMLSKLMLFDLTDMFGSGNEPTIEQFNQWYDEDYYSYTLSRKELLQVGTTLYDDTDIMSQATYQLYNATDKYFNISQFFGFENLWDYMVLNWFGGNVTIYLRIFWQLLTYWLVVSIAWLIFDLFMYVPKLAHRWLDRSAIE